MKRWLTPEREARIVELYERYENAREVARELGISCQTVYRTLENHGVKRTHRHSRETRSANGPRCGSRKYCPVVIVMLYKMLDYDVKQIAEFTGYRENGIRGLLTKRGLRAPKQCVKKHLNLAQIEREYVELGMSTYELGKKYGVSPTTISKWMKNRGISFGKGNHQRPKNHYKPSITCVNMDGLVKANAERHAQCERRFKSAIIAKTDNAFEYVSDYYRGMALIRCRKCGAEFMHTTDLHKGIVCRSCESIRRQERERNRQLSRIADILREYAKDKTCNECGETFHSLSPAALYCSKKCKQASKNKRSGSGGYRHYYKRRYGMRYKDFYHGGITLKKLYERDGGICQICGKPCNWDDREWGSIGPTYPSLDHIVPRSVGGVHTWANVQLACFMCNSKKRDLTDAESCEAVTAIGA